MVDDMDHILNRRYMPEPATNLAERIIDAAARRKKPAEFSLKAWLDDFLHGLELPQPALVMGMVLFMGLMLGFYVQNTIPQSDDEDISAVYIQDSFTMEDLT